MQKLARSNEQLSLYGLEVVGKMLKARPGLAVSGDLGEILSQYIQDVAVGGLSGEEIRSILYVLTLTKKGLRQKWI